MDQLMKIRISRSLLHLILLQSLQAWNIFCFAPQGCSYTNELANCDFELWAPPLLDKDFGPDPPYELSLRKIHGAIPAEAFSGLNGPLTNVNTFMKLFCCPGCRTRFFRSIFTPNLHWVSELWIYDCYLENGLPSRLLENLRNLKYLKIAGGGSDIGIEGMVEHDTLAGLATLREIIVNAPVINGTLPAGFFDGLKNLTMMDLRFSKLNIIPHNWFNGLVSLEKISLSYNNLQTLPRGLFDELSSLKYISLQNNPWNCSCELMWLLGLSFITVGSECQSPSAVEGMKFSDAFGVIDCALSSTTILSTQVSYATQLKETQVSPSESFTALSTLNQAKATIVSTPESTVSSAATSLKKNLLTSISAPTKISSTSMPAKIIPVFFSATTPKITKFATILSTTSTMRIPTASWKASAQDEIKASKRLSSLSTVSSSQSAFAQTFYSSTRSGYIRMSTKNANTIIVNETSNIGLIAGVGGVLTVLPITATVLYRRTCQKKGIEIGMNRVSSAQEERDGEDSRNIDRSSTPANP